MPVIGVYTFCGAGSVLIHEINQCDERVFASINGKNPEWCDIVFSINEYGEYLWGFYFEDSDWFINLDNVMRVPDCVLESKWEIQVTD